ncbi:MAG: polymer-forming cytoskeletal protein [Desulfobacterales bacterium]
MPGEPNPTVTSIVSRSLAIEGEVSGEESLHVDGRLKGTLRLNGDLVVGPSGIVEAEIEVRDIFILGTVTGRVTARRRFEVQPSGRFQGEAAAAAYEIHPGAVFEGISRMLSAKTAAPDDPRQKPPASP